RDEAALVRGERTVAERIEPVPGPEGPRWLLTLEVVVRDEDGTPTHLLSLHQDVTARLMAEQRLAQSRAFLEAIVAHLPWALTVTDARTGEILMSNPAAESGLLARYGARGASDETAAALVALDAKLRAAPGQSIDQEIAEPSAEGRRWHRVRKVAVPHGDDPCRWVLTLAEDVTERHRMLARLQRSEAMLRRSQAIARLGSWRWTPGSRAVECSDELCRLLGLEAGPRAVSLRTLLRLVHPEDRRRLRSLAESGRDGLRRSPLVLRARCLDGRPKYLSLEAELVTEGEGFGSSLLGTAQDVTDRVEAEQHMRRLALHDYLTGLPNRVLFDERLAAAVAAAARGRGALALHCIDLNDFKGINDTLGHAAGDALLREAARRLQSLVRSGDLVARLGGDEFAILQHDAATPAAAAELASRVIAALARPFKIDRQEVFSSASIGIALATGGDLEPGDLLRRADIALFAAKAAGRGSFRFFSPELNARLSERKRIEARLRIALESRSFELAFQPQVALRTGALVGVEALLRWRDPELGLVPPDKFIPVAEDSSQILALGELVLSEACARAARWRRAGLPLGRIAVNLSPAQFAYQDLVDTVARVLRETGLPASALELEITESTLMRDRHGAITTLEALHALGVSVALDDFGTGYSSLSYLKRFPLDKIKIDRSFVSDLPDDPDDVAIARTIITLGKTLGLTVLAEGVETPAQRDFLLREGCDEAQGYLFARPLTAEQLETMLRERRPAVEA
ncbi:MAG: EAL domain-containing protein, partial [Geminicoccaceae bacterium]|nr:EAL domain-containing protein [Geminicoccaceae bacterium]